MKKTTYFTAMSFMLISGIACTSEIKMNSKTNVIDKTDKKVESTTTPPNVEEAVSDNQINSDSEENSAPTNKNQSPPPAPPVPIIVEGDDNDTPVLELITDEERIASGELISAPGDPALATITEEIPDTEQNDEETPSFHSYSKLNTFLKQYVSSSGKVNYKSIKSNKSQLEAIVKEFQDNYPNSDWSSKQKLTYWINAYNVFTIKLIIDNYPTSSITKITAKPWDKAFIKLGGKTYTLNNLENDIIRKRFNEPRIHFALNCASESCPVLLNAAFTPEKLYSQLTSQTKRFLKDSSKNDLSNSSSIKISKIFDWYKVDFTKNGKTVVDFINKYSGKTFSNPKIGYTEYSWELND